MLGLIKKFPGLFFHPISADSNFSAPLKLPRVKEEVILLEELTENNQIPVKENEYNLAQNQIKIEAGNSHFISTERHLFSKKE